MRYPIYVAIFIAMLFLFLGCPKDQDPCISLLGPPMQTEAIDLPILDQTLTDTTGGIICTIEHYQWAPGNDEALLMDPTSSVIYPGSILKSGSVVDGSYTEIVADRNPITISHSANGESVTIDSPNLSNVRKAVFDLSRIEVTPGANHSSTIKEIHSAEHLSLSIKGNYRNSFTKIEASFDFSKTDIKSRYLIHFTQVYYTVDVNAKGHPDDWFSDPETVCQNLIDMPVYISSIKYGRVGMIAVESTVSSDSVGAALNASFSAFGHSGTLDTETEYANVWSSSSFKTTIIGGDPNAAVKSFDNITDFKTYIEEGAEYSESSPGSPIAYTMSYLDGPIANIVKSGDYNVRTCDEKPYRSEVLIETTIPETRFCAIWTGVGDSDFDGNGPLQIAEASLKINNNDELILELKYEVCETESNWTRGLFSKDLLIWKAGENTDYQPESEPENEYAGYRINKILKPEILMSKTPNQDSVNYKNDNGTFTWKYGIEDHNGELFSYPEDPTDIGLVSQFIMEGDTNGSDLCTSQNTECCYEGVGNEESFLQIDLNDIVLELVLKDN